MKDYYNQNIEAIKKINPTFAEKLIMDKNIKSEYIEIINKKNFLVKIGGKELLAYEKDNENTLSDKTIKEMSLYNNECTVIFGIGNGYMLNSLLKKADKKHLIFLVEPISQLINFAINNYNFTKYFENGNLILCTHKNDLSSVLAIIESQRVIQQWHTIIENYTSFLYSQYSDIMKLTMDTINQLLCNVGTVMGAGKIIAENDIKNLPYIIKHRGIKEIKNIYKNKPAIVILSAPTVTRLIPQLLDKKVRDKIIIIAIAQMLRPLLAFGITPDFVCTVDYGEVNIEHFNNLWHIDNIPLVALNRSYSPILEKWAGPKFIVTGFNPCDENTVVEMLNEKGSLEQGGSVGHMAIGLGIHLGCNPIIHIGFDCAYESGLSHNVLGDAVGKINFRKDGTLDWDVDDPNSILKKENHKMGTTVYIPGYFGTPVPTNSGLASFVTAMNNIFNNNPKIKFINSCEGGAKKESCEQMSLKKALKTYCKFKINKNKINKYLTLKPGYKKDIIEAKRRLKWEMDLFDKEVIACDNAIKPLNKMNKADNKNLKLLLAENEKYAIEAQNIAKQSNLLSLHIYKTSREIHNRELKVNGKTNHLLKDKNDLKIRVKRSKLILEAAKESSIRLKEIYKDVLNKIDNKFVPFENKIDPTTWKKLIENGNWARPLLENDYYYNYDPNNFNDLIYTQCFDMKIKCIEESKQAEDLTNKIEHSKLLELSRKYGLKKDFKNVLICLKKAYKIFPNNIESMWGLATTYHHTNKIDKAIKMYEKIINLNPDNKRFKYELGQVWLLKDIKKGIYKIIEVMNETNEFDNFYIRLAELTFGLNYYLEAKEYCERYIKLFPHSNTAKDLLNKIKLKIKEK